MSFSTSSAVIVGWQGAPASSGALEKGFERGFYENEEDAVNRALEYQRARAAAQEGSYEPLKLATTGTDPAGRSDSETDVDVQ